MRDGHNPVALAGVDDCTPTALDLQRVAFFPTADGNERLRSFIIRGNKGGAGGGGGGMVAIASS